MTPLSLGRRLARLLPFLILVGMLWYNMHTASKIWRKTHQTAQCMMARWEMNGIRTSLVAWLQGNGRLPAPGSEFDDFIREGASRTDKRDPCKDRWGHKYQLSHTYGFTGKVNGFRITSAGPDGRFHTADDIVVEWHEGK